MAKQRKKKHGILKAFLIIVIVLAVGFVGLCFLLEDDEDTYVMVDNQNELTQLVEELSTGGKPLTDDYQGEYGIWGIEETGTQLREYYTNTANAQNTTLMVYMIGADLESEDGSASADLQEMIASENGENLNVVVQTGGAAAWQSEQISADKRQRWLIQNNTMILCEELEQASMCSQDSLSEFISWSANNFPADRYMLIMWDHGGGTMGGFGYDENYPDDTLTLSAMVGAVKNSGVKLDIMSYDACLMGTLEVAYAFEPMADYLLASEESEPGEGWCYTNVLSELSKNPSMSTLELGARFIDEFSRYYKEAYESSDITLSLVDLREVPALYEACGTYYQNAQEVLETGQSGFTSLSVARSQSRSYGDNEFEQIDLVDYVQRTSVEGAQDLIRAAFSAVKYRNESSLTGSYGTAVYFPYNSPEYYSDIKKELEQISYTKTESFYDQFLSILESSNSGNNNSMSQFASGDSSNTDYSQESWFDGTLSQDYDYQSISNDEELIVNYSEEEDAYLLTLTDEEWESITDIQLQVMLDDGEGYMDLGSDQQYDWTEEGDLILDFDGTWISIDGHLAAFYAEEPVEDGEYTLFTGTTPAMLNDDTMIELYLRWRLDENGEGEVEVIGYIPIDDTVTTRPKGYLSLKNGDEIQLLCDYYTYDGEYDDCYYLGDPFTVTTQESIVVDWYDLEECTVICWIQLTDWFQQYWYTETIEISYEM